MRRLTLLLALIVPIAALVGCGSDESREDADDVGNGQIEKSAPSVIAFNNHYPNVEVKCDGYGDLLLVVTHDSGKVPALTVLPGHPLCTGHGKSFDDLIRSGEQRRDLEPPVDPALYPSSSAVVP